jgi:hypothetical protein
MKSRHEEVCMPFYQVFAQVYPAQGGQVLVHTHISPTTVPELPAPSLVSVGTFHTLRRSFTDQEQAEAWALYLQSQFAKGPVKNPVLNSGQLELFE